MDASDPARRLDRVLSLVEAAPDHLLAVVGPTASGKTELAIRVAERVGGEIVSADSVQVYRSFDLGSGKPTAEERARAEHHLVSLLDPLEPIDAAAYAARAGDAIARVRAAGKVPILCGGTYFWVRALVLGLVDAPAGDPDIRARHRAIVEDRGRFALHAALAAVDPAGAERLHPNDVVRVSRALEVHELTGRPLSAFQADHGFRGRRFESTLVAVDVAPGELDARITERVVRWLGAGWIDEVHDLLARGYAEARAMGAVGYREVHAHLRGEIPRDDLAPAIVRSTRVFARRQRTWLRRADVNWV